MLLPPTVDPSRSVKTAAGVCLDNTNKIETLSFKMLLICRTSGQKLHRVQTAVIEGLGNIIHSCTFNTSVVFSRF